MSPAEDASLLLGIEAENPEEDWGFLAQQAGIDVAPELLELQVFSVDARHEEGPFQLPGSREALLRKIEALLELCERDLRSQA